MSCVPCWDGFTRVQSACFPLQTVCRLPLGWAAVTGALYLAGFVLLRWNIEKNGVVLASSFIKLGVLVPALLSITVFHESPQPRQIAGLVLAVGAIFMMQPAKGEKQLRFGALIALLLAGGAGNAMSKVYEEIGPAALKDQFLMYIFFFALLFNLVLCIVKGERVTRHELLWGLLIGVPNYYCTRFLLLSLSSVPAVIAYPSYSAGGIVLVALVGILCFHEKLGKRKLAALLIITASLVLLNL